MTKAATEDLHAKWRDATFDPTLRVDEGRANGQWWKLFQGDCRALLPQMPAASVDCVVTSPPYYWQRDYGVEGQLGLESSIDGYVNNLRECFRGLWHVLARRGTVFLNIGDTYYSAKGQPKGDDAKHKARRFGLRAVDGPGLGLPRKSLIGIPWRVALALARDGWTLRSSIIWVRETSQPEPTAHDRPWRKYEFIFIFVKQPRYYFNREGLAGEEDVWYIEPERNAPSRGTHYAPYPRALVERCLNAGCPPGGVVLDPFVGGGTTMAVALKSERSAVGIELNPQFCDIIPQTIGEMMGPEPAPPEIEPDAFRTASPAPSGRRGTARKAPARRAGAARDGR